MKILIAASVQGIGDYEEILAKEMYEYLKKKEFMVDYFLLPYKNNILSLPDQIIAYRMLDLSAAEILITIGYPACFLKHPNKYIYLLETAPAIHEYWDSEYGVLGNYQYSQILLSVNSLEKREFLSAKHVTCASKMLVNDLKRRYEIETEYLYLPDISVNLFAKQTDIKKTYFIFETCLPQYGRIFSFLKQMKESSCDKAVYLYIPDSKDVYYEAVKKIVAQLELEEQVTLLDGRPSDEIIRNAKAVLFFEYDVRRPQDLLRRCAELKASVIVAEDSGYAAEICGANGTVPFREICRSMMDEKAVKITYPRNEMESFVKGILRYEDSII